MAEPQFTPDDRKAFQSLLADQSLIDAKIDDNTKRQKVLANPAFQRFPERLRGRAADLFLKNAGTLIPQYISEHPPQPTQDPPLMPKIGAAVSKAWDWANTPLDQGVIQKAIKGRQEKIRAEANKSGKPLSNVEKFAGSAVEEGAGLLDSATSPLGLVTFGIGPKLGAMARAGKVAGKAGTAAKAVEKGSRLYFGGNAAIEAAKSGAGLINHPTAEGAGKALAQGITAAAMLRPRAEGKQKEAKGSKSETKAPDHETHAKRFGVTPEQYAEAQGLSTDQLANKFFEVDQQYQDVRSALRYDETARDSLRKANKAIDEVQGLRDQAELNLQDTTQFDEQLGNLKGARQKIHDRLAQNGQIIKGAYEEGGLKNQHRMYEHLYRKASAPPPGAKVPKAPKQPLRPDQKQLTGKPPAIMDAEYKDLPPKTKPRITQGAGPRPKLLAAPATPVPPTAPAPAPPSAHAPAAIAPAPAAIAPQPPPFQAGTQVTTPAGTGEYLGFSMSPDGKALASVRLPGREQIQQVPAEQLTAAGPSEAKPPSPVTPEPPKIKNASATRTEPPASTVAAPDPAVAAGATPPKSAPPAAAAPKAATNEPAAKVAVAKETTTEEPPKSSPRREKIKPAPKAEPTKKKGAFDPTSEREQQERVVFDQIEDLQKKSAKPVKAFEVAEALGVEKSGMGAFSRTLSRLREQKMIADSEAGLSVRNK